MFACKPAACSFRPGEEENEVGVGVVGEFDVDVDARPCVPAARCMNFMVRRREDMAFGLGGGCWGSDISGCWEVIRLEWEG